MKRFVDLMLSLKGFILISHFLITIAILIQSIWLDLKIIALTIKKVLKGEGISAEGEATMNEFYPQITQIDAD